MLSLIVLATGIRIDKVTPTIRTTDSIYNVEDMPQAEIDSLANQPAPPTIEEYLIDLDFRLSKMELGL